MRENHTIERAPVGWHRADIVAALRKSGTSLRRLAVSHNLAPTTLTAALSNPYPRALRLIAEAIGQPPHVLWPDLFDRSGRFTGRARPSRRAA